MDIRPQDLPEIRDELVRQRDEVGPRNIAGLHVEDRSEFGKFFGLTPEEVAAAETAKMALATLFHVSREMTELAAEAARTLPPFAADEEDFPAEVGMVFFNGGVAASWGGRPVRIHAGTWQVLDGLYVALAFFIDMQSVLPIVDDREGSLRQMHLLGASPDGLWFNDVTRSVLRFNEGLNEQEAEELRAHAGEVPGAAGERGVSSTGLQVLRSALLLMQQPLAAISEIEPDRAARKRLRREGREPATVRVIELRRPKHAAGDPGESGRNYVHRWITRGHWRQQWYPSREVHRPVWIAPHVKGPEGAPMIGGEKVYAWKR